MTAGSVERSGGWDNVKCLITGASGFIGRHLCQRLCAEGSEVHATSRQQRPTTAGRGPVWWQADMAELSDARRILTAIRPDIVFHLSGFVGANPDPALVTKTYESQLTSTVNALIASTEAGCRRIIQTGSLTEPGPGEAQPTPRSPYTAAKWAAGAYGRMFHKLYGTPVVILRPSMVYGPGQDSGKLIPYVIRSLLRGESPRLSSGQLRADWIYVADVIDGFLRAAAASGIDGKTVDLGTGVIVSVRDIVERLVDITCSTIEPMFGVVPDRSGEAEMDANITAAFELIGWRAATPLETGLRRAVEWFRTSSPPD